MKSCWKIFFPLFASAGFALIALCASAEEEYVGVFQSGQGSNRIERLDTWADVISSGEEQLRQNLRLVDIEAIRDGNQNRYISVWRSDSGGNIIQRSQSWEEFLKGGNDLIAKNLRLVDLEVVGCTPTNREFIGVWQQGTGGNMIQRSQSWEEFLTEGKRLIRQNLRLVDVEVVRTGSQIEYFGVWRSGSDPGNLVVRSNSWEEFLEKGKELTNQSLRLVDIDIIRLASGDQKLYLSVWRSGEAVGDRVIRTNRWTDFLARGENLVSKGLRLVDMSVLGSPCPGVQGANNTGSGTIGTLPSQPPKIASIDYLGNFPSHRQSGWSHDLQGIANDAEHWFFTQTSQLWKFPISHDLNDKVTEPVLSKRILGTGMPRPLKEMGFDHFGDLDQYRGFLFIPVEDNKGKTDQVPVIAVFRASDLAYVGSAPLITSDGPQRKAGWVAIHPISGLLYTSNNTIDQRDNPIFIYQFNIQDLRQNKVRLTHRATFYLKDEQGSKITLKPYLQGGVFSNDGTTLFLVNGKATNFDEKDGGIWVFDAKTGKKLMKSAQSGSFKYQFSTSKWEEPEGITFWDLDRSQAPRIPGGQLHVILLDNDSFSENPPGDGLKDEFYLKHYRIHYDRTPSN